MTKEILTSPLVDLADQMRRSLQALNLTPGQRQEFPLGPGKKLLAWLGVGTANFSGLTIQVTDPEADHAEPWLTLAELRLFPGTTAEAQKDPKMILAVAALAPKTAKTDKTIINLQIYNVLTGYSLYNNLAKITSLISPELLAASGIITPDELKNCTGGYSLPETITSESIQKGIPIFIRAVNEQAKGNSEPLNQFNAQNILAPAY